MGCRIPRLPADSRHLSIQVKGSAPGVAPAKAFLVYMAIISRMQTLKYKVSPPGIERGPDARPRDVPESGITESPGHQVPTAIKTGTSASRVTSTG
jgi:hypothetical protein